MNINPMPGTCTGAHSIITQKFGPETLKRTETSWEVTGSHIDADQALSWLAYRFGDYATVACIEIGESVTSVELKRALRL
ncbi:hypothetical protein QQX09_12180 [Demequina sp. SYSU T00192]|uniref:Uncharacterized protein n=1 Tax=Demequina litoralis TaxID=3051660 RepID=A0ABT8GBV2_9MICO|nr:hypothetical protein [Demequina sp. SYSU T00192]MDN4476615.1 hypothetical protein [Demequina sp. SYSU T00192]